MNVLALLLVLFSWAGQKKTAPTPPTAKAAAPNYAGHYVLEDAHEMGSELLLKPNGDFEYMLAYGAADYTAIGKWKAAGDSVVLDSKLPDGPGFKLVRSSDLRSPDVRIWVKSRIGKPVGDLEVVLTGPEGESTGHTDRDGMALFPGTSQPKSVVIKVPVYDKDSGPVQLNASHTDFTFEINPEAITTVPFKGEVLKASAGTLEMFFWDKTKPMVYRRQ